MGSCREGKGRPVREGTAAKDLDATDDEDATVQSAANGHELGFHVTQPYVVVASTHVELADGLEPRGGELFPPKLAVLADHAQLREVLVQHQLQGYARSLHRVQGQASVPKGVSKLLDEERKREKKK